MARLVYLVATLVVLSGLAAGSAVAQDVPSSGDLVPVADLLADPTAFSDRRITIEGELVGDYGFRRDGFMWTQLNDDSYARRALVDGGPRTGANVGIGLRVPTVLAEGLDPVGGYRLEGPLVRATGYWRYHDPERGGESFFDAEALEVVKPGRRLEEGPDWIVFVGGVALLCVAGALWLTRRRSGDE